ncbi:hypothetical protein QE152_g6222 [Popillia japonica]|uniref:Uncharacterized protein n=1 Tax=Popillia japonica TaxID=7064 RepID=A0AAW1MF59_POPJA
MTLLSAIVLDESDFYVIKAGFAETVTKLTTFNPDGNLIEVIESNVLIRFNTIPLQRIRLNSNRFYIADGAFHGMNLKYLRLNDNRLTRTNSTWFYETTIKRLLQSIRSLMSKHSWKTAAPSLGIRPPAGSTSTRYLKAMAYLWRIYLNNFHIPLIC